MLVRAILTIVALAYAGMAWGNGLDRISRHYPGLEAIVPGPFRAQADRAAAAIALFRDQPGRALPAAEAAVARDPIDPDSTALLGQARLEQGDPAGADAAFRVAARFGWRNEATQSYWYFAALEGGDYKVAAERLDAILRAHPTATDDVALLAPIEDLPAGRIELARRIARSPGWVDNYLVAPRDAEEQVLERRFAVLRRVGPGRIDCEDLSPFATSLIRSGRLAEGRELWNRQCPQKKAAGFIAEPSFARVVSEVPEDNPFGWRSISSGDLSMNEETRGETRYLVLANSANSTRPALMQPTAFPAGAYRIEGIAPDGTNTSPGDLMFSLACEGENVRPRVSPEERAGGFQIVTIGNCRRQSLRVWVAPNATAEVQFVRARPVG